MPGEKHIAAATVREFGQAIGRAQEKLLDKILASDALTPDDVRRVIKTASDLALAQTQLVTNAVGVSVRDLELSVAQIRSISREAEAAIDALDDLQKGLRLLALLAGFATSLAMADVKGIVKSGVGLVDELGLEMP